MEDEEVIDGISDEESGHRGNCDFSGFDSDYAMFNARVFGVIQ